MTCYHPIPMWYSATVTENGKRKLTASYAKAYRPYAEYPIEHTFLIPCGQCVGCRLDYSRRWAVRCVHEFQANHNVGMFLTLTYDPEHLPKDGRVHKEVFQKFMKRLRKAVGEKVRFFACGEYGEKYQRPHYHALIFGYEFPDQYPWKMFSKDLVYCRSPLLERLWPFGFSLVGRVTFESCAYVARYIMKKQKSDDVDDRQPFCLMSRMPGLGQSWYEEYKDQIYPNDFIVIRDGIKVRPPKYYDRLLEKDNPVLYESVKSSRKKPYELSFEDKQRLRAGLPLLNPKPLEPLDYEHLSSEERVKARQLLKLVRKFHDLADTFE